MEVPTRLITDVEGSRGHQALTARGCDMMVHVDGLRVLVCLRLKKHTVHTVYRLYAPSEICVHVHIQNTTLPAFEKWFVL